MPSRELTPPLTLPRMQKPAFQSDERAAALSAEAQHMQNEARRKYSRASDRTSKIKSRSRSLHSSTARGRKAVGMFRARRSSSASFIAHRSRAAARAAYLDRVSLATLVRVHAQIRKSIPRRKPAARRLPRLHDKWLTGISSPSSSPLSRVHGLEGCEVSWKDLSVDDEEEDDAGAILQEGETGIIGAEPTISRSSEANPKAVARGKIAKGIEAIASMFANSSLAAQARSETTTTSLRSTPPQSTHSSHHVHAPDGQKSLPKHCDASQTRSSTLKRSHDYLTDPFGSQLVHDGTGKEQRLKEALERVRRNSEQTRLTQGDSPGARFLVHAKELKASKEMKRRADEVGMLFESVGNMDESREKERAEGHEGSRPRAGTFNGSQHEWESTQSSVGSMGSALRDSLASIGQRSSGDRRKLAGSEVYGRADADDEVIVMENVPKLEPEEVQDDWLLI